LNFSERNRKRVRKTLLEEEREAQELKPIVTNMNQTKYTKEMLILILTKLSGGGQGGGKKKK